MVLEITDSNFETLIQNNPQPAVIDFWAQWCGPCRAVSTSLETIAEEYGDKVVIGKVDVDTNPELTLKYGIRNMPTILYVKDGKVMDKQIGSTSRMALEEKLRGIL